MTSRGLGSVRAIKADLDRRWEWIWQEDLPKELEEAQGFLGGGAKL